MLAMLGLGIGLVDRRIALGTEELRLRQFRPAREIALLAPVQLAHFLQAHDIGIEPLDGVPDVVDLQPAHRPYALHSLVDVVGRNPQSRHSMNSGSIRMASALDGEKQVSAAWRYGNHW